MSRPLPVHFLSRRQVTSSPLTFITGGGFATAVAGGDARGGNRATATTTSGIIESEAHDNSFSAPSITVPVGTTAPWAGRGQHDQSVGGGGALASPGQKSGQHAHPFAAPDTVAYACSLRPGMTGKAVLAG